MYCSISLIASLTFKETHPFSPFLTLVYLLYLPLTVPVWSHNYFWSIIEVSRSSASRETKAESYVFTIILHEKKKKKKAAEPFVIQAWRSAFSKWFIAPSTKRDDSLISWKREKKLLWYPGCHVSAYPQAFVCPSTKGETTAHWQTVSVVWQTSGLIHQRTKADKYFPYGSWRSFLLPQPWTVFLLLYSCLVLLQLHRQCVLLTSTCTVMLPIMLWEDQVK